ncbi:hypothetical protein LXA43DRAFT_496909 [Ganoderma leucocontextum]|nr:hypothetical protein LXA43DRAFT_496909 [Ganoderma leucocontextum]
MRKYVCGTLATIGGSYENTGSPSALSFVLQRSLKSQPLAIPAYQLRPWNPHRLSAGATLCCIMLASYAPPSSYPRLPLLQFLHHGRGLAHLHPQAHALGYGHPLWGPELCERFCERGVPHNFVVFDPPHSRPIHWSNKITQTQLHSKSLLSVEVATTLSVTEAVASASVVLRYQCNEGSGALLWRTRIT